jgi:tau tubulin kinase
MIFEVDLIRNIAIRHSQPKKNSLFRRASVPTMMFLLPNSIVSMPTPEEEEQAVACRLEIRVVDATGGATIVQTSADTEPIQSMNHCNLY